MGINDVPNVSRDIETVVNEINNTAREASSAGASPVERLGNNIAQNKRPTAIGVPADVTSSDAVGSMVTKTVSELGPLTLMVSNAGIAPVKDLLSTTTEDINSIFNINFTGTFNCYTQAARQMIAQGDPEAVAGINKYKIVGASSIVSFRPLPFCGIYSASKFAVRGLTHSMAAEMGPHKITVNTYAPGIVGTKMWEQIDEALGKIEGRPKGESIKAYSKSITLGRTSVPEDIANLVGFLSSADSDYVTGQTMLVDGGIVFT